MSCTTENDRDTGYITSWRSILTLIVFILTNIFVLFPFKVPIYIPKPVRSGFCARLSAARIIPKRPQRDETTQYWFDHVLKLHIPGLHALLSTHCVRYDFPVNFVTAPLIAVLFLLATLSIGRQEVHDGTVGDDNIFPIDIMVFFLTLAYIAISIDASGLIRYLAYLVLRKAGKSGQRLFFYLYVFFFLLASFIGNDPIVLSGTAFLAYMTRVSDKTIKDPRAWIHMQFTVANIGSAVLVSSNPTNLVLAGSFNIRFVEYTANMIVPVIVTAVTLFPFLLWVVFPYDSLIPPQIVIHDLPENIGAPVNPNIPYARGAAVDEDEAAGGQSSLPLEEIMNPFIDKKAGYYGAALMATTLITILVLNAVTDSSKEHPVFYVTLPAAFVMLCLDLSSGWLNRTETRKIAKAGREAMENSRMSRSGGEKANIQLAPTVTLTNTDTIESALHNEKLSHGEKATSPGLMQDEQLLKDEQIPAPNVGVGAKVIEEPRTLVSITRDTHRWCQETFPTVTAVLAHLPYALVPFALCMFVLVQGLKTKGWVPVFAHGWNHWINRTGTIGAIGGMGFLSVILCNFAGTNIGTTIMLCRVVQSWVKICEKNHAMPTDRTFWATVYSMAIGVNYGAFSTAFSASLAGLLWRDILARKFIKVGPVQFARVNFRIIAFTMVIALVVLIGEIYIYRKDNPYKPKC